jgi:hypothetical protein
MQALLALSSTIPLQSLSMPSHSSGPTAPSATHPREKQYFWPFPQSMPQGWLFGMQAPAHSRKPSLHMKPHFVPSQVEVAFWTAGHGSHDVPQVAGRSLETQLPLQSCLPGSEQLAVHGAPAATHLPAQAFMPVGQEKPHLVPSQVAVPPPLGASQLTHAAVQWAVSLSAKQPSPQR